MGNAWLLIPNKVDVSWHFMSFSAYRKQTQVIAVQMGKMSARDKGLHTYCFCMQIHMWLSQAEKPTRATAKDMQDIITPTD